MAVHRLICRWDFNIRPKLMDLPGQAHEVLGGTEDWPDLQENSRHTYVVKRTDDAGQWHRTMTYAPTYLAFSIEWRHGVDIAKLATRSDVVGLFRSMDKLRSFADLSVLKRAGLRVFEIDQLMGSPSARKRGEDEDDVPRELIPRFIDVGCAGVPVSREISRVLGTPIDVMWRQVGVHPDGKKYTVSCGPFGDDETKKYFEEIHKGWNDASLGDFIADSDIADRDFAMTVPARSWAVPIIELHSQALVAIKLAIKGEK